MQNTACKCLFNFAKLKKYILKLGDFPQTLKKHFKNVKTSFFFKVYEKY